MKYFSGYLLLLPLILFALLSCNEKKTASAPSKELISQIDLKRGNIITCGPPDQQLGKVDFDMSCDQQTKEDFNTALALLHSFEYDESEKVFAKIIDASPGCAMAYWGVAMSNFHPLWTPPSEAELQKGAKAIEITNLIDNRSKRESGYINAIGAYYKDWEKTDHLTRCLRFEKAMEELYKIYPDDKEAALFYALALDASADPSDKTFANQKKAGAILNALYPAGPDHPGIIHYIIHTYDYPGLADLALPAARKYAKIAPSSAHALHMPSHIFTRLGLWDECIESNKVSVSSAKCYAESAGIKGHWDEELHGLDYLVYAYLQKGDNEKAKEQLRYLETINDVSPLNFKVAYSFAAIPARMVLENKNWQAAASLQVRTTSFPWKNFPWQEALIHFTKAMGNIHVGYMDEARAELAILNRLRDTLEKQKDPYKTKQVEVQIKTCAAWLLFKAGNKEEAWQLMKLAADMEDSTGKHPVTPGEVLPARELLGDMLLEANQNEEALQAYESVLEKSPNRFNALNGAGRAAERSGNNPKAIVYYKQLLAITENTDSKRPELTAMRSFVKNH